MENVTISLGLSYPLELVAPVVFRAPVDRAGFSGLDPSAVPPEAAPAPTMVWISSMNRIAGA